MAPAAERDMLVRAFQLTARADRASSDWTENAGVGDVEVRRVGRGGGGAASTAQGAPATEERSGSGSRPSDTVTLISYDASPRHVRHLVGRFRRTGARHRQGHRAVHAVHWLALLTSLGLPLPTTVFVHSYLTVDGTKISNGRGNAVDPVALVERVGTDAVRCWLLREVRGGADTDFTHRRLVERADRELAHGLGNLVNRTVALVHRCGLPTRAADVLPELTAAAAALPGRIDAALGRFDFRAATDALWAVVERANRAVERERPWERREDVGAVLAALPDACRCWLRSGRHSCPTVPPG